MTDRELKRLSREDLLEMLVTQSREVERLKREKNILITQLKCLKKDFEMTDSLRFDLVRRGIMKPGQDIREVQAELDDLIRRCESGEFTEWVIQQAEIARAEAEAAAEAAEEAEEAEEAEGTAKSDEVTPDEQPADEEAADNVKRNEAAENHGSRKRRRRGKRRNRRMKESTVEEHGTAREDLDAGSGNEAPEAGTGEEHGTAKIDLSVENGNEIPQEDIGEEREEQYAKDVTSLETGENDNADGSDSGANTGAESGIDNRIVFRLRQKANEWRRHAATRQVRNVGEHAADDADIYEDHFAEEDGYEEPAAEASFANDTHTAVDASGAADESNVDSVAVGDDEREPKTDTAEMNRMQEALAWAKVRFGGKK